MIDPKELIQQMQSYGAKLKRIDDQNIRVTGNKALPPELIEQLRAYKPVLLEYLKQTYLDIALKRALDGYHWLLEQEQKRYRYNRVPSSDVQISVQQWRQCIADVIGLNPCEVQIVEAMLIKSGELIYYHDDHYIMCHDEAAKEQVGYGNVSFSQWLDTGRQFFRH